MPLSSKPATTWLLSLSLGACALAVLGARSANGEADKASAAAAPSLVSVIAARAADLPITLRGHGHVVPLEEVEIRSQASGIVRGIHFLDGDQIRAGQLLFTLDGGDQAAQLQQAQAQVAQIRAELEDARRNHARAQELLRAHYISASALDTLASNVDSLQAQLQAAQAQVRGAQVRDAYTRIHAPISGRAGAVDVHPGGLVQEADATPMVRLVQLDPISIEFTLPEQDLGALLAAQASGQVRITAKTAHGEQLHGALVFIDNSVDSSTGTIALKADFANPRQQLWPGAFVAVALDAGADRGAFALPPQAVLEDPQGHYVFAVDHAGKAQRQPVTLLRTHDGNSVVAGLHDGVRVVVEGNRELQAGSAVAIVDAPAAAESLGLAGAAP